MYFAQQNKTNSAITIRTQTSDNQQDTVVSGPSIDPSFERPTVTGPKKPDYFPFPSEESFLQAFALSTKRFTHLYALVHILNDVFTKNNLYYWADGGSMLGAARHQGIIPIDDDADLCIWNTDKDLLMGPVKTQLEDRGVILSTSGGKAYLQISGKQSDVFCDLFHCIQDNGWVTHGLPNVWETYRYRPDECAASTLKQFGPTQVHLIQGHGTYLSRAYPGWQDKMILTHAHIARGSLDPRLNHVAYPVTIEKPARFPAAPWDQDLFEDLTRPPTP